MRNALTLSIIFLTLSAHAQFGLFLSRSFRFDSSPVGTGFDRRDPWRFGASSILNYRIEVGGDLTIYNHSSESGAVSVYVTHQEVMPWLRASLWDRPSWNPYGIVGLGVQRQIVRTSFFGSTQEDAGDLKLVSMLGVGSFHRVYNQWEAGAEVRLYHRPATTPKNSGEFSLMLGYRF